MAGPGLSVVRRQSALLPAAAVELRRGQRGQRGHSEVTAGSQRGHGGQGQTRRVPALAKADDRLQPELYVDFLSMISTSL